MVVVNISYMVLENWVHMKSRFNFIKTEDDSAQITN